MLATVYYADHVSPVPVETELYELLGVPPNASESDIKKAYKKKAKEHHPDKNPNDPDASQRFQEMAAAYEILVDAQRREIYDMHGMDGVAGRGAGGHGPGGMDAADLFAEFFGAGGMGGFSFDFGPGMGHRRTRSQNSTINYDVTLEDLYNGKSVRMNMEREVTCETCKGSGARGSAKPKKCAKCEGKGWTFIHTQVAPNQMATSKATCSDCDGEGEKLREKDRCKKCKGEKVIKEKTRQEIRIEKGMQDRQRVVLAGAGDQVPGAPPGDVIFVFRCKDHESFERSGDDLLTNVKITLSEALLGFSRILITHLDGRGIMVSSPPGKILSHGHTIVLRGEGMPKYKHPDIKGDLYVVLELEMPDGQWLRSVDRAALEQLLPPKKPEVEPRPAIVDEASFEDVDIAEFGEDEDAWEDEDEDEFDDEMGGEPECRPQ